MSKRLGLFVLAMALAGCNAQPDAPGPRGDPEGNLQYGELTFEPCSLTPARGSAVEAHCATLAVPENHDEPGGRTIDLAIALVVPDRQPEPDPLVFIAGGPGESALESYPGMHGALGDARSNRIVLLMDARGTGGSHPLECSTEGLDALGVHGATSVEVARTAAERCRDALSDSSDLRLYTTGDHIRDLDLVRATLGIEQLNLIGLSYGTRVAQQYAKRYPQHTRTVTLDSSVPNSLVLGSEHARNADAALRAQFARCRKDAACASNLGDPQAKLEAVRDRLLSGGPQLVRYRDPVTGEWRTETPSHAHLAILLRLYAYAPDMAAAVPLIVHDAAEGRYEGLLAQARVITGRLSDAIAHGMELSVMCAEDHELAPNAADEGTLMGVEFIEIIRAQCELWPRGTRAEDFRAPLTGDVPLLAVSGEFDPVTPPRYGDEIVSTLPNGRHLVLPEQGHGVLGIGCMPKLFAQFIEDADAAALDATCLERLSAPPPFAGAYGWEP